MRPYGRPFIWIYFAKGQTTNIIKVGRTIHIRQRLIGLCTEAGERFQLLAAVPSIHLEAEQVFHRLLAKHRVEGKGREWFKCTEADIDTAISTWLDHDEELLLSYRKEHKPKETWAADLRWIEVVYPRPGDEARIKAAAVKRYQPQVIYIRETGQGSGAGK